MNAMRVRMLVLALAAAVTGLLVPLRGAPPPSDWPDWRGPTRDGVSPETGLPESWSPAGDNLAWMAPYGGRSTPVVLGDHVYLQNPAEDGERRQERLMCFDADTGRLLWERRFNVYLSDVPPHRVGWASPVADPETGNVYVYGVGADLRGFSSDGVELWHRPLGEEFGMITTHGGRTASPVVEGDLVIVSGNNSTWGTMAAGAQRFFAFDKHTGDTVWVSSPGGRPSDTVYSTPVDAVIGGTRLLLVGGADGAAHAFKPQTGEPVWKFIFSKRGINTGVVVSGTTAFVSHGEENLDTSDMGLLAAIDAAETGTIEGVRWKVPGFLGGYSSPVIDGDRIYQIDNGANLFAFDLATGRQLWTLGLATIQKASPVFADGKLYVGAESGEFFIIRPGATSGEILDRDRIGTEERPEAVLGSVAVASGRVYFASEAHLYAIGPKGARAAAWTPAPSPGSDLKAPAGAPAASVQVVPTELVLAPGDRVTFRARSFDERGRFIREADAQWALEGLEGAIDGGRFTTGGTKAQAGLIKATVGGVTGEARVRVIPPLPWSFDFEGLADGQAPGYWVNATGKYLARKREDGNTVLVKRADNPFSFVKRARTFMGPSDLSGYTIEADMSALLRRRQMGDGGVIAQRYALILFGAHQRVELQSWQPETARTVRVDYPWKPDVWYRLKLRVENRPDGTVLARGKVWPRDEPEPVAWTIERIDPIGNREGSPGLYGDGLQELYYDNIRVYKND